MFDVKIKVEIAFEIPLSVRKLFFFDKSKVLNIIVYVLNREKKTLIILEFGNFEVSFKEISILGKLEVGF